MSFPFSMRNFLFLGIFLLKLYTCIDPIKMPDYPYEGKIYSGYLDLTHPMKKLHYMLVESENSLEDPLVLWLNGGPGCSSLSGFSQEQGPALFIPGTSKFQLNPYRWNKKANILFLESPAGVGFSKNEAEDEEEYWYDDTKAGEENLQALLDFFIKFPHFSKNKFFITGESYAGIYIPYLASLILDHNENLLKSETKLNLGGIMIGNGVTDWSVDSEDGGATYDFAFNHALYPVELRESYEKHCLSERKPFKECQDTLYKINKLVSQVNVYSIYEQCYNVGHKSDRHQNINKPYNNKTSKIAGKDSQRRNRFTYTPFFNIDNNDNKNLKLNPPCVDETGMSYYYNQDEVQAAFNIKDFYKVFYMCSDEVYINYIQDKDKGSFFLYPKLIAAKLRIWIYSGNTDSVVPFNGTEKWIKKLNLPIKSNYKSFYVKDPINSVGYVTEYEGLTFITVKGAGHMVPQSKPEEAEYIFNKFLTGETL
jgi:cathepsin A (carboxypeptidase C)